MEKQHLKITTAIAIITILLIFPAIPSAVSIDESKQLKVNAFLHNVLGLDTENYETKLVSEMTTSAAGGSNLLYNLNSENIKLEIIINFRNNELVSCSINQIKGSVTIANPDKSILSAAQTILDKYQAYSNAPYIQSLKTNIDSITELKNTTITTQFSRFSIRTQDGDYQYFEWMNSPNGIHNMYNRLTFIYQDGSLKSFTDAWNQYPVGDYKEVLSKEQAIAIAKDNLETYSYEYGNETITNLQANVKTQWMIANLTMQPRDNVLYPNWEILLPLDKVYPGFTYGFRVMIWADTGEVISARATGSLGNPIDEETNPLVSNEPTDSNPINYTYIIAVILIAIIIITAIVIAKKIQVQKIAK
ncbi:MAG TPA: hypothetical protein VLH35_07350 [Candidatus Acidoferrales bacterium]|nr:hypothetical protein [Candidatus Acidoferrales bacterium]